ncbi:iron ABC transporter permease [Reinekea marina]|uniref:FecCD family ABC transporter permease n=1 Tax=Reinekea marina TaxID=1310421 RepID=A0ABV7WLB3_9GAMM|nr:iron ABC transporter permease [Reinekea marina]MDN3650704.1 iron ABC transporter permease [Reinekea marina]
MIRAHAAIQKSSTIWLSLLAPVVVLLYLALGSVPLPFIETLQVIKLTLFNQSEQAQTLYPKTNAILMHIRLPRAFAAILAGSALALAGAAMQGLFRNPLASPNVLGISAGSSLGAVIAITTGLSLVHPLFLPGMSVAGAMATAALVYVISIRIASTQQLLFIILTGLAISSLLSGATSALLLIAAQYEVSQYVFWTMGGLEGRMWQHSLWPAPFIIVMSAFLFSKAQALNLLSLGEENAHGMGLNVQRSRKLILILSSVLTALAISIAGPVGFIGLMVPHLVRLIVGPNHKILLPMSAYVGAMFILLADLLGRTIMPPYEIKVGIITAVVGGAYFIYLIIRYQKYGRLA